MKRWPALAVGLALLLGMDALAAPAKAACASGHGCKAHMRTHKKWRTAFGAGREVFRIDAYLRPFHLASSLDYVASGAYRDEPSFQRYAKERAERLRLRGATVDLMQ